MTCGVLFDLGVFAVNADFVVLADLGPNPNPVSKFNLGVMEVVSCMLGSLFKKSMRSAVRWAFWRLRICL